jgi:Ca2+-binding EF-hand superfamily protein
MRLIAILAAGAVLLGNVAVAQQMPTDEQRAAAFAAADKNKDGKLDKTEYASLVASFGADASMADQLFAFRDKNKDGFVDLAESKAPLQMPQ